jgi:hypothetical protein
MHLQSVSNFRAIAIIMIVAGHTFSFGFMGDNLLSATIKSFLSGNTTLFVFISGYMFHHVFYNKFEYKKFMVSKVKNIGIPYFILSTICLIYVYCQSAGFYAPIDSLANMKDYYPNGLAGKIFLPTDSSIVTTLKYYFVGAPITAYWYIPFALILFTLSPFHFKFIKASTRTQLVYTLLFVIISLITYRPEYRNPIINVLYFTPVYLIGIISSIHRDKVLSFVKPNLIKIMFVYVLFIVSENALGFSGLTGKVFFEMVGIDLIFIDKLLLIALIWGGLEKYEFNNKIINTISKVSFAIFFIHGWVLFSLTELASMFFSEKRLNFLASNNELSLYFLSVSFTVFLSVVIALLIKRLFQSSKNTRYLIGY